MAFILFKLRESLLFDSMLDFLAKSLKYIYIYKDTIVTNFGYSHV
jgi:hypothetical protein